MSRDWGGNSGKGRRVGVGGCGSGWESGARWFARRMARGVKAGQENITPRLKAHGPLLPFVSSGAEGLASSFLGACSGGIASTLTFLKRFSTKFLRRRSYTGLGRG